MFTGLGGIGLWWLFTGGGGGPGSGFLLLEDGSDVLLENGSNILLG